MPVFLNLKIMFFKINAYCQAGQKTLYKTRLNIFIKPRLLNNNLFKLYV